MNVTLINEVLDKIVSTPDRWNQCFWVSSDRQEAGWEAGTDITEACGTTFCMAGWTLVLSGKFKAVLDEEGDEAFAPIEDLTDTDVNIFEEAASLLEIDAVSARRIFIDFQAATPETYVAAVREELELA